MIHLEEYLPISEVEEYVCFPDEVQAEAVSHYHTIRDACPHIQAWEAALIAKQYAVKECWELSPDGTIATRAEES